MSTSPLTPGRLLAPPTTLLLLLLSVFLGMLLSVLAAQGLQVLFGLDLGLDELPAAADTGAGLRYRVRAVLFVSQAFSFLLPGWGLARWLYGPRWAFALGLRPLPSAAQCLIGCLVLFSALGLVVFSYQLNERLPLPVWAAEAEERSDSLIGLILRMETGLELIASLGIVAVLAAVGEELIFRGLLQPTLTRWFGGRGQAAIWVTAAVFSAIHFQWAGFLPRLVLGVVLGYLFYLTGRLWVPILAHALNNGAQVIGTYFLPPEAVEAAAEQAPAVTPLQAGCSLLLVLLGAFALQRISPPAVPPVPSDPPDE